MAYREATKREKNSRKPHAGDSLLGVPEAAFDPHRVEGPMQDKLRQGSKIMVRCLLSVVCAVLVGCITDDVQKDSPIPRELRLTTLPPYVIEPPDILIITTLSVVPRPPYRIRPLDILFIQVANTLPDKPISGLYTVEPDGRINFGVDYGSVELNGLTLDEAQKAIQDYLTKNALKNPRAQVSLSQSRGIQQIQGDHLVRMDGTIGLGVYGSVYVAGMTLDQARRAIEEYLSKDLVTPEISLDVFAYNSKWYYVIADRAGYGQTIVRLPITGRDTVLDAVSQMYGTLTVSSNKHVWLARPNGEDPNNMQIFPVNWPALTKGGSPGTNYQLLPGDRLYIQSNPFITANNRLSQFFAPIETAFGFTLLGAATSLSVEEAVHPTSSGAGGLGLIR
jgi:polysaccharide biosynthesis/export protein